MTAVRVLSGALDDGLRREETYGGDLLALADAMIREAFGEDPGRARLGMDRDAYLSAVEVLQKRFRRDGDVREAFLAALERVGVDLGRTFWGWLYLRVSPHGGEHGGRRTAGLGFHRDTWSSNVYAQTNWWAPIYPIDAGRTIAFYPAYSKRPLRNTSRGWDLEDIRAGTSNAPVVPGPDEPMDTAGEVRAVIEPGDLLCFSGARLHASVPNTTGIARFSIEVRTVDGRGFAEGRRAPNVDGEAPRMASGWFRHSANGAVLAG